MNSTGLPGVGPLQHQDFSIVNAAVLPKRHLAKSVDAGDSWQFDGNFKEKT